MGNLPTFTPKLHHSFPRTQVPVPAYPKRGEVGLSSEHRYVPHRYPYLFWESATTKLFESNTPAFQESNHGKANTRVPSIGPSPSWKTGGLFVFIHQLNLPAYAVPPRLWLPTSPFFELFVVVGQPQSSVPRRIITSIILLSYSSGEKAWYGIRTRGLPPRLVATDGIESCYLCLQQIRGLGAGGPLPLKGVKLCFIDRSAPRLLPWTDLRAFSRLTMASGVALPPKCPEVPRPGLSSWLLVGRCYTVEL
ncbi:hypothetical protein CPAR01_11751 [Colletotrichum paranaense]|uniref:Uncharacterized protein n=1 Tax=Colletotrichum paranaense TaxID=1914294 RepID=A0ABQ9S824_9PEZI|nr:uncharacterized protein CPAR01_11751 [Colletotrichum paranaense]KAK1529439.1 hypothetical protein CPAR01_11751 [Colletotrichum paranaense]